MQGVRIAYLDVIRIFACILIITMHAPMPYIGTSGHILSSISLLTAPGIGLFFMVSGALLLPVQEPTSTFLKKRITKVVYPTLFWTFFYLLLKKITTDMTMDDLCKQILSIPFTHRGHSILWFMYTLIGLYLLSPIISPWLQKASKKEIEWVLLLWGITLCYPLLEMLVKVNESRTGMLYYFSGYAGYFLLGYYLHKYRPNIKLWLITFLFLIPLATAVLTKITNTPINFYKVFWYLSILIVMMAVGWFRIFQIIDKRIPSHSRITLLSNCCFGIYLVHIFIMRGILWKWDYISAHGGVIQIILTVLLTFTLSFMIIWGISKLPFAQYIIGFKSHKKYPKDIHKVSPYN